MHTGKILAAGALALALSACGTDPTDRMLTGAGIGAGAGAATAAVTDGNAVKGAIIGGAAGALAGAVTDANDVYLGRPVWKY